MEAEIFDGRRLRADFDLLRAPIPEFMVFGGMMVSKADIDQLLKAGRDGAATLHAARLGARYLRDRFSYRRGTRETHLKKLCRCGHLGLDTALKHW